MDDKRKVTAGKIKICVSGAASLSHCGKEAEELARELGREIVRQGAILVTGATTGFPYSTTVGVKEMGGISIGVSPASSEVEHIKKYRLPVDHLDLIMYTGFGYAGRNLLLTRTSDAVIIGCGRIGTLNEFTIAFEDKKPIGVLEGPWTMDETVKRVVGEAHRGKSAGIVYDHDPKALVEKVFKLVRKEKSS